MDCKNWLIKYLARQDFALAEQVRNDAKNAGFSKAELKIARKGIGVKTFHQFDGGGATANWFWYLREDKNAREKN